jgi:hypothetical protein
MLRSTLLAGLVLATLPMAARAAESYDNCAGTVTSLPATIGTAGVWCMKGDLATGMASGTAITINASNVTLDCNHFRLGGLAAGTSTQAIGIGSMSRNNVTVRNCNVRGFLKGINLVGSGNVVEDNRLDGNTLYGVHVDGEDFLIRRNLVTQTGPSPIYSDSYGILTYGASGVVEQNLVSGVVANQASSWGGAAGIVVASSYTVVRGNDVTGISSSPADGIAVGIAGSGTKSKVIDNTVSSLIGPTRRGLSCPGDSTSVAIRNTISDVTSAIYACTDGGGNVVH